MLTHIPETASVVAVGPALCFNDPHATPRFTVDKHNIIRNTARSLPDLKKLGKERLRGREIG